MKYKNTLVTGGSGLVGSTISSNFKPSSKMLNLMKLDNIISYIKENNIDSIIHCAAKVGGIGGNLDEPGQYFYENIVININVLEAARICGVKKVVSFMSTCVFPAEANYPLTPDQIHKGEPHFTNFPYAYAKRMIDVMGRAYKSQYNTNFVSIIPCNVYGPNDNFNINQGHVIPSIIHKCYLSKIKDKNLNLWGTGKSKREFIYSKDLGFLSEWALQNYESETPLIISPDEEYDIDLIARKICKKYQFKGDIVYNGKKEGQFKKPSDNKLLKSLLPKFEFTSIDDGISETIDWFLENYEVCRK